MKRAPDGNALIHAAELFERSRKVAIVVERVPPSAVFESSVLNMLPKDMFTAEILRRVVGHIYDRATRTTAARLAQTCRFMEELVWQNVRECTATWSMTDAALGKMRKLHTLDLVNSFVCRPRSASVSSSMRRSSGKAVKEKEEQTILLLFQS